MQGYEKNRDFRLDLMSTSEMMQDWTMPYSYYGMERDYELCDNIE